MHYKRTEIMFYKKSRKKKKNKGGSSGFKKFKTKKSFGLSNTEMSELITHMSMKAKIPIYRISEAR